MRSDFISYFGYGSLVNRDTRPTGEAASNARLNGWHRVWEHRVSDATRACRCTSLSIEPVQDRARSDTNGPVSNGVMISQAGIDGVLVRINRAALPQLDAREAGYERLELPATDFDLPDDFADDTVFVYRSRPENRYLADTEHPVLQSYIDCVMAGYLQRFGQSGLQALLTSTRGWERTILNDRESPFYPRWVPVHASSQRLFDASIRSLLTPD